MIILQYHEIFFRLTAPRCPGMAAGAVCLRKSHDIIISSFCNVVNDQAYYHNHMTRQPFLRGGNFRCKLRVRLTTRGFSEIVLLSCELELLLLGQ